MAILKRRIKRKNSSDYDVVHFETDASLVLMNDGTTAEAAIAGKAPSNHRHNQIYAQPDSRDVATKPSDYFEKYQFVGIKSANAIGITAYHGGYSWVIGFCGWADQTGGKSYELAFNDSGIFWRVGSTDTWECWNILSPSTFNRISRTADNNAIETFIRDGGYNRAEYDFNEITADGIHECGSDNVQTNTPYGSANCHFFVMVFHHSTDWIRQVAYDVRTNRIYTRTKNNGNWGAWCNIHTSDGEIGVNNGIGIFGGFDDSTNHCSFVDDVIDGNNRMRLQMYCNKNGPNSGHGLQIYKQVSGTFTHLGDVCPAFYSTADPGVGSALESGSIYYVYE